jgi:hypothetical protein
MQARVTRALSLFVLLLSFTFLASPQLSLAQDATATILGQVVDPAGSVVPDAAVSAINVATNVSSDAKSDRNGNFQINQLPIGSYRVVAKKEGFAEADSPTYKLQINQSQRIDIKFAIGGTTQTVSVSVQAASIDTVSSTVGGSVTERPLVDLPLNGRNILDLAQLQPGVTTGDNPGNTSAGTVSIAGGRTDSVTFLLDGGNNTNLLSNGVVFSPNPDAVEEFRILENNYSAEYGRNGGGVITIVSKSGTDKYHGTLYEFNRNPAFNANDFFNKINGLPRNNLKRNQYGGTIGGEIFVPKALPRRNRNFFFFSYEGQKLTNTQNPGQQIIPTTAEVQNGDFSTAGADGGPDPAVAQFLRDNPYFQPDPGRAANAIIDPTRFDPVAVKYIAAGLIPSNANGSVAPVGTQTANFNQYNGRFDFVITDRDRLSLTLGRQNAPTLLPFAGGATVAFPVLGGNIADVLNLSYTRTFTPNILNEARFVAQRFNTSQAIPATKLPTPAQLGIGITPDFSAGPTRLFDFSTGFTEGFSPQGPTTLINNTFAYSDNLSWVKGSHNLKFGAYFSPYQNNTLFDFFVNGEFDFFGLANIDSSDPRFANIGSQTGFAEFLVGTPDEYFQFGAAPSSIRSKDTALFAQDDWHVTRDLTLNLGLRYEYATPKTDTRGRSFSLVPGAQSTRFINAPQGVLFPGDKGAPSGANFPIKNDFAPRFGFAYDVGGHGTTVVRGGAGVFFDILKGEDNLQFNGQAPFFGFSDLFFTPPTGLTTSGAGFFEDPYGATGSVNPFPSKPPAHDLDFGAAGFLPFGGGGVFFVDPHLRTPYTIQYNFGLQRGITRSITAEAAYVGSVSRKYTALSDSNPFVPGTTTRLYNQTNGGAPNFSFLDTFRNVTNGNYSSLQAQVRKQTAHIDKVGTTYFQLSYTFAKNMDNVSGFRQRNGEVPYYNPGQFYAVSDLDVKHRIVLSGGWDLPFDEYLGGSGLKLLTKGWSLYPIVSYQTGFPLDVTANLPRSRTRPGPSGAGDSELVRANLVGPKVVTLSPHKNPQTDGGLLYVSPSNFSTGGLENASGVIPATPTYGSLPRNAFRGPDRQNIDLSVAKVTQLLSNDRLNFELRGDFFNLFNSPEFANPNTTITSSQFGQITSTYTDSYRIVQIAGKLRF